MLEKASISRSFLCIPLVSSYILNVFVCSGIIELDLGGEDGDGAVQDGKHNAGAEGDGGASDIEVLSCGDDSVDFIEFVESRRNALELNRAEQGGAEQGGAEEKEAEQKEAEPDGEDQDKGGAGLETSPGRVEPNQPGLGDSSLDNVNLDPSGKTQLFYPRRCSLKSKYFTWTHEKPRRTLGL